MAIETTSQIKSYFRTGLFPTETHFANFIESAQGFGQVVAGNVILQASNLYDALTFAAGSNMTLTGNASTKTITFGATFPTMSALTLQFNGVTDTIYNGSASKTFNIRLQDIGAAASGHTHTYLPLSGGTLAGALDGTTATFSGNVTSAGFYQSSDSRLKENVLDILPSTLDKAAEVRFVEFEWQQTKHKGFGVIAQELAEIYPELVAKDNSEDAMMSVDYTGLHTILIAKLLKEVNDLKQELQLLKQQK
jgi:hypothetical protein